MSGLVVIGLSHHTAPVAVRERFFFRPEQAQAVLARIAAREDVAEAVLLSTCNRTEVYCRLDAAGSLEVMTAEAREQAQSSLLLVSGSGGSSAPSRGETPEQAPVPKALAWIVAELCSRSGLPEQEARGYFYLRRGRGVAKHLFRVVSSLDSLVVGEAQIQGQVKEAYEIAAAAGPGVAGTVLTRLFQNALAVGGRVRDGTELGIGAASVPSAAIELARKIFGQLRGRRALVLGSGDMSELALDCFAREGMAALSVASRSEAKARRLAERVGGRAVLFEELGGILDEVDIVLGATAAPHAIITRSLLERALPGGPKRPLLMVDIALPRDVDPAVSSLENVFLYDMDDLRQIVQSNLERRHAEIPAAERIVDEGVAEFWAWYSALEVVPVIKALRGQVEALRQQEVEKALGKLGHLSPEDRAAIEALTRQIMRKVLHSPTVRLRDAASNGRGIAMMDAARYLFELRDQH